MKNSRDIIFEKIKAAREAKNLTVEKLEAPKASGLKVDRGDLIDYFKDSVESVQGEVYVSDNQTDCIGLVENYITKNNAKMNTLLSPSLIDTPFRALVNEECSIEDVKVGISTCELLAAQTGTAIVSSQEGRRILGLSPIHIIIAERSQLRRTLDEAVKEVARKYGDELPSQLTLITGPSRTADIEKTLILGAHGPKKLVVFIY